MSIGLVHLIRRHTYTIVKRLFILNYVQYHTSVLVLLWRLMNKRYDVDTLKVAQIVLHLFIRRASCRWQCDNKAIGMMNGNCMGSAETAKKTEMKRRGGDLQSPSKHLDKWKHEESGTSG